MADQVLTFEELRSDQFNKPAFRGKFGIAWQTVMGKAWDIELDRITQARRARCPDLCPLDGLFYLGLERMLERVVMAGGASEAEGDYRGDLRRAWSIWNLAGSADAHIASMQRMGLTNITVHRRAEWNSPPAADNSYVNAFQYNVWAQFDILIDQPYPWKPLIWGGWIWGDGHTWGSTATAAEIDQIRRLLRQFRAAHETPTWAVLNLGGGKVWGGFVWGDGTLWAGGTQQTLRWLIGEPHWNTRGLV